MRALHPARLVGLMALVAGCAGGADVVTSEATDPTAAFDFPDVEVDPTRPGVVDLCEGADSSGDSDGDGVCNDIDPCPDDEDDDSDGDGSCDSVDLCEGDDADGDEDEDGICDSHGGGPS